VLLNICESDKFVNAIQNLNSTVSDLEQLLAVDIAELAAGLEPLPNDRDTLTLETAWRKTRSSRYKLSLCLKDGLRQIKATKAGPGITPHQLRTAQNNLKAAQAMLRLWGRFEPIVEAQLPPERRPLATKGMVSGQQDSVMNQVVDLFLASMHKIANPFAETQSANAKINGCHRDIPWPMRRFSEMIGAAHRICLALRRHRPLRFLDVGSGGGTKVLAATMCFESCHGLEYEISTLKTGRQLLELLEPKRCRLIHCDALEFSDYAEYDVIYFYKPFFTVDKMVEMEERIFAQARPGTVLLAALGLYTDDLRSKGVHEIVKYTYITGMSGDEAAEIGRTAELMGPMVPGFGRESHPNPGYWKPLLEVSARNGYFL